MVIGTDSPLFPGRILRQALRELHVCESVLGPCPDGGSDCSSTARRSWGITEHLSGRSLGYSPRLQRYASELVAAGPFVFGAGGMRRRRLALRLPTPEKGFVPRPEGAPPGPGDVEVLEGAVTQSARAD
jgi:hypothetical protein